VLSAILVESVTVIPDSAGADTVGASVDSFTDVVSFFLQAIRAATAKSVKTEFFIIIILKW
jgi:hypothetical protein